jgi:hypothetical protein
MLPGLNPSGEKVLFSAIVAWDVVEAPDARVDKRTGTISLIVDTSKRFYCNGDDIYKLHRNA